MQYEQLSIDGQTIACLALFLFLNLTANLCAFPLQITLK